MPTSLGRDECMPNKIAIAVKLNLIIAVSPMVVKSIHDTHRFVVWIVCTALVILSYWFPFKFTHITIYMERWIRIVKQFHHIALQHLYTFTNDELSYLICSWLENAAWWKYGDSKLVLVHNSLVTVAIRASFFTLNIHRIVVGMQIINNCLNSLFSTQSSPHWLQQQFDIAGEHSILYIIFFYYYNMYMIYTLRW